jgi:hypothetical protein
MMMGAAGGGPQAIAANSDADDSDEDSDEADDEEDAP